MDIAQLLALCGRPELEPALGRARYLYQEDVMALDAALEDLFVRLRDGVPTHVVITADHGESFGEAGALGHGKRVTPEQVRVPLAIVSPRVKPPARREDTASTLDLPRTLLSLAGVAPRLGTYGGRDLLVLPPPETPVAVLGMRRSFDTPKPERTTDGGRHALPPAWFFTATGPRLLSGNGERVLEGDDRERELTGAEAERVRAAFADLERVLDRGGGGEALDDPEALEGLRALGYGDF